MQPNKVDSIKSTSPSNYIFWLRLILVVKIFGFAAISQSAAINKAIKIGLGISMTIGVLILTLIMSRRGYEFRTEIKNSMSLGLYVLYLTIGTASIFWANDYMFAIIQVFRDFELLVFYSFGSCKPLIHITQIKKSNCLPCSVMVFFLIPYTF